MNKISRIVKCPRCGYTWKYTGKYLIKGCGIISCSHCKTTMELAEALERGKGHPVSIDKNYKIPLKLRIQQQIKENKKKIKQMEEEKNEKRKEA